MGRPGTIENRKLMLTVMELSFFNREDDDSHVPIHF